MDQIHSREKQRNPKDVRFRTTPQIYQNTRPQDPRSKCQSPSVCPPRQSTQPNAIFLLSPVPLAFDTVRSPQICMYTRATTTMIKRMRISKRHPIRPSCLLLYHHGEDVRFMASPQCHQILAGFLSSLSVPLRFLFRLEMQWLSLLLLIGADD